MKRRAIVLLVLLSACGGPSLPLQVIGKNVPIDVAFGNANGALPPVRVQPTPGGFIVIPDQLPPDPLGPIRVPPPPFSGPCKTAGPFEFPAKEAGNGVAEAPAGARYVFRVVGQRTTGDTTTKHLPHSFRQVGNVGQTATGNIRFDVSETAGLEVAISSYAVSGSEIGLTGVQRVVAGERTSFAPLTPLKIFPLPPRQTNALGHHITTWNSAATDPLTQTSVVVDGSIIGKALVDACGKVVDTWVAELGMRTVTPDSDYTTTWRINVAPQYGGLIVAESIVAEGTRAGEAYAEKRTATISQVPR